MRFRNDGHALAHLSESEREIYAHGLAGRDRNTFARLGPESNARNFEVVRSWR